MPVAALKHRGFDSRETLHADASPLPPEEAVTETTRKGFLSGLSLQQKLIWLAVLIGLPILVLRATYFVLRATYFSDEQIRLRRDNEDPEYPPTIDYRWISIPSPRDEDCFRPTYLRSTIGDHRAYPTTMIRTTESLISKPAWYN
ncbi:MAG: hypothetical protein KDA92_00750 [Planctomycetales bacterium]|nr:hypothetical protein [Planctomycetales bacterium]MCA9167916.1 hypothetical protein [Planctomycetales bacterium]